MDSFTAQQNVTIRIKCEQCSYVYTRTDSLSEWGVTAEQAVSNLVARFRDPVPRSRKLGWALDSIWYREPCPKCEHLQSWMRPFQMSHIAAKRIDSLGVKLAFPIGIVLALGILALIVWEAYRNFHLGILLLQLIGGVFALSIYGWICMMIGQILEKREYNRLAGQGQIKAHHRMKQSNYPEVLDEFRPEVLEEVVVYETRYY
jgi:hypothetical protein